MGYDLFKIINLEYAEGFIQGKLYMNPLDYFRGDIGNSAQGDWQEGTCGTINKNQLGQVGYRFSKSELEMFANDNVTMLSDYYAFNNLFCMYSLELDEKNKVIFKPDKKIYEFNDANGNEKIVIHITNTAEFLRRLDIALNKYIESNKIEYGMYGEITYSSAWTNADGMGTRSAFHKEPSYSYQKEWRLCILQKLICKSPFILEIGDLSDITETITIDIFINNIDSIYPNYKIVEYQTDNSSNTYKVFGSINMVNRLMYSYTGLNRTITRSDKAEADWHYAQYLILNNKLDEADVYLENQMKHEKDFEHLELVVQNRMPKQWVKATDAYMYFINEYPQLIISNPERFFFGLHSILMMNKQPADAAKLYFMAREKYALKENLIMYSDVLFALGFFDKAIPIYEKMRINNNDPIILYDLAIAYSFILDFDKSSEYLNKFETFFLNSVKTSDNTKRIKSIIECFKNEIPISETGQPLYKDTVKNSIDLKQLKDKLKDKNLFAGIDILYDLQRNNCIHYLDIVNAVYICPATIQELIEVYLNTGDKIIYDLIINLKNFRKLKITSPNIQTYIAFEMNHQDIPAFMIMEKALLVEYNNKKSKN